MAQLAVIKKVEGIGWNPLTQYDKDHWNLGSLIKKKDTTSPHYIGPIANAVARPVETSAAMPGIFPHVIRWADKNTRYTTGTVTVSGTDVTGAGGAAWITDGIAINTRIGFGSDHPDLITTWYNIDSVNSNTSITLSTSAGTIGAGASYVIENIKQIDWVFLGDGAAAAATRRIQLYEFDRSNSTFSWKGFVTPTMISGNATLRGLRVLYEKYTTGTVQVATATVTGTGTNWLTARIVKGNTIMSSRIGFGTTDPTQVKNWYYINTITAEGTMTISTSEATNVAANITVSSGTAYVIEDILILSTVTNATAANGGLWVQKGVSYAHFKPAGTTFALATTVDDLVAGYFLRDNSTQSNTNACGIAVAPMTDRSNQTVYVLDATGIKIYKYNVRAALTVAANGLTQSAWVLTTGNQSPTGTIAQNNNGRLYTAGHGPASGQSALYFVTTTRIYACLESAITSGSTSFQTYQMTEVPPGSTTTFAASAGLACIETVDMLDRFVVTTTGAAGVRSYITQFRTDGGQMDHIFLCDDKQIDQSTVDSDTAPHPTILAGIKTIWSEGGLLILAGVGTTAATNLVHCVPIGAEWTYSSITGQYAISPEMVTPNCVKYICPFVIRDQYVGDDILGKRPDAFRVSYRTTGISDNSGSWTLLSEPYDMSGVAGAGSIQFKIEFKTITDFCVPGRIFQVGVVYEDASTDSHYRFSGTLSSASNKQFAFRFANAFGSAVPRLRIRLYNDVTNSLLLDDDSTTQAATWAKSTNDGGAWGAYNTSDKANETTYIRVTYATLGDNIKVRAVLTLY